MPEDERSALLVVRCQLGEREAFTELVHHWHDALRRYVRALAGSPQAADDLAQETWLAVVRSLPRLRQPDRFAPWLFTIARRTVADHLRRDGTAPVRTMPPAADGPAEEPPTGGDAFDGVLDTLQIQAGLDALPPAEREVLVLFHLQDLPLDGCAEVLGVPSGTVKSRLHRARRMLRTVLDEKGYDA
ncbi:RNA polymerase sigma factor [Streptomyces aidingensis]|uniref:RNA polymerase sigma-70 factor, ECF subfamily n=1 Tax=Streptomyces aidingensis TaxID=910347 RepID=A0A1I1LPK6_9ACTN|nr:RNA polymerase sigma factor [Streptomyces aidingensis]SFC71410.1 RNA polymerase sigma-70 factor, ECF subfamily [Streptomyces aidingensis]